MYFNTWHITFIDDMKIIRDQSSVLNDLYVEIADGHPPIVDM